MQTCLEKRSIPERHQEIARNEYNVENPYNENHPNALATGDAKGRGTGWTEAPNDYRKPNFIPGEPSIIDDRNFDSSPLSNAGNNVDNEKRTEFVVRNKYTYENPYTLKESTFDVTMMQPVK